MPGNPKDHGHPRLRKAVFIILVLILLVVLGRVVVEAFSFVTNNGTKSPGINGINGKAYNITGESCPIDDDTMDCCEKACIIWCGAKNGSIVRAGVIDAAKVRCRCVCSI